MFIQAHITLWAYCHIGSTRLTVEADGTRSTVETFSCVLVTHRWFCFALVAAVTFPTYFVDRTIQSDPLVALGTHLTVFSISSGDEATRAVSDIVHQGLELKGQLWSSMHQCDVADLQ